MSIRIDVVPESQKKTDVVILNTQASGKGDPIVLNANSESILKEGSSIFIPNFPVLDK